MVFIPASLGRARHERAASGSLATRDRRADGGVTPTLRGLR
jgi:hypothetical protein